MGIVFTTPQEKQGSSTVVAREQHADPYAMEPDEVFLTFGMPLLLIGCFILLVYLKRRGPAKHGGNNSTRQKDGAGQAAAPDPIDAKAQAATASDSLLKDGRKGRTMTIEGSRRKLG